MTFVLAVHCTVAIVAGAQLARADFSEWSYGQLRAAVVAHGSAEPADVARLLRLRHQRFACRVLTWKLLFALVLGSPALAYHFSVGS